MEGYTGPLCSVCASGYFFTATSNTCTKCASLGASLGTIVSIVLGLSLGIIAGFYLLNANFFSVKASSTSGSGGGSFGGVQDFVWSVMKYIFPVEIVDAGKTVYKHLKSNLKIFISLYQIVTSLPFVLDLKFPDLTSKIFSAFNVFNFDLFQQMGLSCYSTYDYFDYLQATTLVPIAVIAAILAVQELHVWSLTRVKSDDFHVNLEVSRHVESIRSSYFWFVLLVTYLILPSVSTAIFRTFSCQNIDPDDASGSADSSDNYYMRADYSISCSSARYAYGRGYAISMIFVYPVGIPALYFYLLWSKRALIMAKDKVQGDSKAAAAAETADNGKTSKDSGEAADGGKDTEADADKDNDKDKDKMRQLAPITFIFSSYKPSVWYWEVVETTRRIFLTGALVLFLQGSGIQVWANAL
jgi:hypothetical protein